MKFDTNIEISPVIAYQTPSISLSSKSAIYHEYKEEAGKTFTEYGIPIANGTYPTTVYREK